MTPMCVVKTILPGQVLSRLSDRNGVPRSCEFRSPERPCDSPPADTSDTRRPESVRLDPASGCHRRRQGSNGSNDLKLTYYSIMISDTCRGQWTSRRPVDWSS